MGSKQINIAAAIILDSNGQTLLVRKTGTKYFMQPGGKIDDGEDSETALVRELLEELELTTSTDELQSLGTYNAVAANEANHEVVADLFLLKHDFSPKPASEIAEAIWITPKDAKQLHLAPLTRYHVMPILDSLTAKAL